MSRKFKIGTSLVLAAAIFLGSTNSSFANYYDDKIESLTKKIESVDGKISEYKDSKNNVEYEKEKVEEEIKRLDKMINETSERIVKKENELDIVRQDLIKTYEEIRLMEIELKKREESFRSRVQSMHSGDKVTMFDVVLSSDSIGDLISRVFSFKKIVKEDNRVIEEYLDLVEKLNNKKKESEKLLAQLEKHLDELEFLKNQLNDDKFRNNELKKEKERQSKDIETVISELEDEKNQYLKKRSDLEIERNNWKNMLEARNINPEEYDIDPSIETEIQEGRMFITPTKGRYTSGFGPRWGAFHYGIDLANVTGTPIYASAEGEIIYASNRMGGYGNAVMIRHNLHDRPYVTVYAHLDAIGVKLGQKVNQGDVIGLMGNTGRSYGSHLHFEIQESSEWSRDRAVDPWKYLKR